MALGLTERVQAFKEKYLDFIEDNDTPEIDSDGKTNLRSILHDIGYRKVEGDILAKINHDKSIDVYVGFDPINLDEGFAYLQLNDIEQLMGFKDQYTARTAKRTSVGNATIRGSVAGFLGGFAADALVARFNDFELVQHKNIYFIIAAGFTLAGAFIGYVGSQIGYDIQEAGSQKFLLDYKNKTFTGKKALVQAMRVSQ
jgi:hypothetical protein